MCRFGGISVVNKGRLRFLTLLVVVALLTVSGRLVWIQVVKAEWIAAESEKLRVQTVPLMTPRGAILDRNLKPMAMSVPYYRVVANHLQIHSGEEEQKIAEKLAPVIGLTADQIAKKLHDNPRNGYIKLQEKLGLEQKQKVEDLNLQGIALEDMSERLYPGKSLANQVLGYMTSDGTKGEAGLEAFYESFLAGKPGYVKGEFTTGKTPIEATVQERIEPTRGQNLILTIDMNLQKLAEDKLDQVVKEQDAKRAAILLMDIHTGELLVMAMRPGAVPNDRKTWGDPVDWGRLKNWTTGDSMPPGSIFKTVTTSAALEEHAITLTTPFIDRGELILNGCRITNWDGYMAPNPAPVAIDKLLQASSNVGLTQVGQRVPRNDFVKYLKAFGFFDKTGIDVDYEETAKGLEDFDKKGDCDWANMYIGQHLEVTPIQMITAVSAIANGGKLVQPHLVRERRDPKEDTVLWTAPPTVKRQVITAETAKEVRDLMVSVIEKGTATAARMANYTTGGKTGTAQKFANGKMKERMLADFVGFAPASNPQYVMLVMVDEPKGQGFGGMIAAPIYGELMPQFLRALSVPPDKKGDGPEKAPPAATQGVVPDVAWMPAPWAEARLAEAGFVPRVKGTGNRVASQSVQAGSTAKPGTVVELNLVTVGTADEPVHVPDFTGLSLTEANRLALEIGLTLKATGSGFVADQEPRKGATAQARSTLSVRLAPRP